MKYLVSLYFSFFVGLCELEETLRKRCSITDPVKNNRTKFSKFHPCLMVVLFSAII
jgi:hypothetical protein